MTEPEESKYERIRDHLLALVRQLPEGTRLPSERTLSGEFGVARMTIRQALQEIEQTGMLLRTPGAGTFVRRPPFVQRLTVVSSFSEDMRNRGLTSSSRLLATAEGEASTDVRQKLRLEAPAAVVSVQRLRLADGEPIAVDWLHVPAALIPDLSAQQLSEVRFYPYLRESGVPIVGGEEVISSTGMTDEEAIALGARVGTPALRVERVSWTTDDRPVELTVTTYRSDRYTIKAALNQESYR